MERMTETMKSQVTRQIMKALRRALNVDALTKTTQPGDGKCAAIWIELDRLRAAGKDTSLKAISVVGKRKGWNENTTRVQFYRWKAARAVN